MIVGEKKRRELDGLLRSCSRKKRGGKVLYLCYVENGEVEHIFNTRYRYLVAPREELKNNFDSGERRQKDETQMTREAL